MKIKSPFNPYYHRLIKSIAQGGLTNSKRPQSFVQGYYPTVIQSGFGCHLTDTNGYRYTDYICGLGTNLFGYANSKISRTVSGIVNTGSIFSMASTVEVDAAERLKGLFPFIEKVKFLKTGSDACSAAVKIARAWQSQQIGMYKKVQVVVQGYHGYHDMFIDSPPAYGVDPLACANTTRINNDEALIQYLKDSGHIACVIIEPIETELSKKRIKFLNELREICTKKKIVLIFDEVITGFRFPKKCVSAYLGIEPDLICFGKAMGGGLPLSAVGGKTEIMESCEYFVSSTFGGDRLALGAFLKVCDLLETTEYDIDELWGKGEYFIERFNAMTPKIQIEGYPTRGKFIGDTNFINLFFQECAKGRTLFGPSWFYNWDLISRDDETFSLIRDVVTRIDAGLVRLEGSPPVSPFASTQRKNNA